MILKMSQRDYMRCFNGITLARGYYLGVHENLNEDNFLYELNKLADSVSFEFDTFNIHVDLPLEYINRLERTTKAIIDALNVNVSLLPWNILVWESLNEALDLMSAYYHWDED